MSAARCRASSFLSTPSARRATCWAKIVLNHVEISIHALREEGDAVHQVIESPVEISIHALREEGDTVDPLMFTVVPLFLSTPSARRATSTRFTPAARRRISIHALREEGDSILTVDGARRAEFLSTPSARRATSSPASSARGLQNFYPRPPRGGRP